MFDVDGSNENAFVVEKDVEAELVLDIAAPVNTLEEDVDDETLLVEDTEVEEGVEEAVLEEGGLVLRLAKIGVVAETT